MVCGVGLSLEMEKTLNEQRGNEGEVKAEKVLEINPNHDVFKAIEAVYDKDPANIGKYAKFLYNNAWIFYIIGIITLGLVLFLGVEVNNAKCWFKIPYIGYPTVWLNEL